MDLILKEIRRKEEKEMKRAILMIVCLCMMCSAAFAEETIELNWEQIGTEEVAVDLYVVIEYGTPIQRAALDAQESVRKAIESMTGLHVVRVDVHVQSVSFEKENSALQAGAASAALEPGEAEAVREPEPAKDEAGKTEQAPAEDDQNKPEDKAAGDGKKKSARKKQSAPTAEPEESGEQKAEEE
jgi:hypothetical protein